MSKNCLILAPPRCGARVLTSFLVNGGYHAGEKCYPCRLDPSESSYEDMELARFNDRLFRGVKALNNWNIAAEDNPFSFSLNLPGVGAGVPDGMLRSVLMQMQMHTPWVRRDPQLVLTWTYWVERALPQMKTPPRVILLLRWPADWLASIFDGCDREHWAHIPKDPDYFYGLWSEYTQRMLKIAEVPIGNALPLTLTLDHLGVPEFQKKLSAHLGLVTDFLPDFDRNKVRHCGRRDLKLIPDTLRLLWDQWQWQVLKQKQY